MLQRRIRGTTWLQRVMSAATAVSLVLSLSPFTVRAAITTNTATSLTNPNHTIKQSSSAVAVLGLNTVQGASETLSSVKISLSGSNSFALTDLATLGTGASSGLALYLDNKGAGTTGSFDGSDTAITLSAAPTTVASTQLSKVTPSGTALVSDAAMTITAGDLVFANITAGGAPVAGYAWHVVTTGATGVNSASLRLDGAGAAPTYVASTQFSRFTPASTGSYVLDGASNTTSPALGAGDVVYYQTSTGAGTWGMVTGTLAANASPINGANLANGTYRISKLAGSTGAFVVSGTSAITGNYASPAVGDIVLYQTGTSAATWGIITNATLTSGTFAINGVPLTAATWQITKVTGYSPATALTTDSAQTITAGDIAIGLVTQNPQTSIFNWHIASTGATGVAGSALRLDGATGAPTYGWVTTLAAASGQAVPANDTGANAGSDFYVVARSSAGAVNGHAFSIGVNAGDVAYSSNTPAATPTTASSGIITIDATAPTLDTTRTGPQNNSTNVPINAFVNLAFSEGLDPSTLTPANVTMTNVTDSNTAVPIGVLPYFDGFNVVPSSPPGYAASSRFAKLANTSFAGYQMSGTSAIVPQPPNGYTSPAAGDIVFFQHDSFPAELGVITNNTLTSGTFAVNGFTLFGNQQLTKISAAAATGAVSAGTSVTTGDIIVINTTANPTDSRYNWHIVTTGAAVNNASLRIDGAGAAPTYASGSSFSTITPSATATDNGATGAGTLAVNLGDLVFAKLAGGSYGWHITTTAGNVSSDAGEGTAVLDNLANAAASLVAASSQMSKIVPGAQGLATDNATTLSFGDVVFANLTSNAANLGSYNFHLVSAGGTGASAAGLRYDNAQSSLLTGKQYTLSVSTSVADRAGNGLASPVTLSFTTGNVGSTNTTPPFVQSSIPQQGNQSFAPNAPIKLTFSVDMLASGGGSVTSSSNIGVYVDNFGAPGSQVTAVNTYDAPSRTVTITPSSNLAINSNFIVKVATTTQSSTNAALPGEYRLNFRTGGAVDNSAPTVQGVSPATGSSGQSRSSIVTVGFSKDMNPTTIAASTITLSGGITGAVSYNPGSRSATFSPSTLLAGSTTYTITVVSGSSGVKDAAGNQLAVNYTSTFTTDNATDSTAPNVAFGNADNFGISVTFSEPVKTGGGPSAGDNISNFSLESPVGSSIALAGKTVTYDGMSRTAKISGLSLQNGSTFKVTVANQVQDLAGNGMDNTGSPAKNTSFGTVQNSTTTGGNLGPGSGMNDPGQQGMNPTRVTPTNRTAGATSSYKVEFLANTSIPLGGSIFLTFPTGFDVTSAAAAAAGTVSFCNADMNGPATGTVTIGSIAVSGVGVTITTAGAATGANAFICADLTGIINTTVSSSAGYTVDIKTRDTAGNNLAILETKTSAPFFLGQSGSNTLTVNVFNDNGAGGGTANNNTKDGSEAGIANAKVFLFSPASGGQSATTNGSGVATITSLANGDYQINLEPGSIASAGFAFNAAPQPITISGSQAKNFGMRTAPYTISGTVTGPASSKIDVFASSPNGFSKVVLTLTGGADAYSLPVQDATTYNVGVGPSVPDTFLQPGSAPPPPPTFNFMPPAPLNVTVSGANVTGKDFVLATSNRTITGTVKDASNTGVSGAGIFCRPVQSSTLGTASGFGTGAQSDTVGAFTVKVTDGIYLCGAFKPGMPPVPDQQVTVASGGNTPSTLAFILGSTTSLSITGTVKDDTGSAIPYAGVSARKVTSTSDTSAIGGSAGNTVGGPTDANGAYTLYVTAGTWVVEAYAPGFGRLGTKTISVSTANVTGQDFSAQTLSMGSITGTVTRGGTAVQGVMVRAQDAAGTSGNMTNTAVDGTYTLKVPAGTYTVFAFLPGNGEATPLTGVAVVSNTATTGKNFALGTPITVTVNVTDGTSPITGAGVDVRDANGRGNFTNVSTTSGANAVYSVSVPPGTYTLRVGHPAYGNLNETSGISTTQTVTVTATAGALFAITGTVTGDASNLGGAWVSVRGTPTGRTQPVFLGAESASNGTFSVSVPAGAYRVQAYKPGYKSPADVAVTVTNATIAAGTIALTTSNRTIAGQVTLSGSGVSNAFVDAFDGLGGYAVAQTDATGNYTLSVADGTWSLSAHSQGYEGSLSAVVSGSSVTGKNITLTAISGFTVKPEKPETVTPTSGGFITNVDIGAEFKLNIPANALGSSSNAATVTTKVNTAMPTPPTGAVLSKSAVTISAVDSAGSPVKNLNDNVTITIPYNPADVPAGVSEGSLVIGVYNDATQQYDSLSTTVDTDANTLTATVSHFSDFAPLAPSGSGAPSAPTNLVASNNGTGTGIALTWNAASGATLYNIYKSSDGGSTFPLLASSADNSYTATGLTINTSYQFKVSAENSTGAESAASSAVTLTAAASLSSTGTVVVNAGGGGGGGGGGAVSPTPTPTPTPTPAPTASPTPTPASPVYSSPTSTAPVSTPVSGIAPEVAIKLKVNLSSGEGILMLQKYLNTHGFTVAKKGVGSPGKESKILGPATVKALKAFQKSIGIPPTGKIDQATIQKLSGVSVVAKPTPVASGGLAPQVAAKLAAGMTRGEGIKLLQQYLNSHGFTVAAKGPGSAGLETTILGGATSKAIKQLEKSLGLRQTGKVTKEILKVFMTGASTQ